MLRTEKMGYDGVGDSSLKIASPLPARNFCKFLYVSNMHRSVEPDAIIEHVSERLKVERSDVLCRKLVKRNADLSGFRFISFKVGVELELFDKINNIHFWPVDSSVLVQKNGVIMLSDCGLSARRQ